MKNIVPMLSLLVMFPALAFAADSPSTAVNTFRGGAFWLMFAVVYFSRKRAIGGWLLYYYVILFISVFILAISIATVFQNLNPYLWSDKIEYAYMFISILLPIMVQVLVIYQSTLLIINILRNKNNINAVRILKYSLLAGIFINLIFGILDMVFDPDNAFFAIMSLVFYSIWSLYFYKSKRVQWVFVLDKWDYQQFKGPPHDVSTESI